MILLNIPIEIRVDRLIHEYAKFEKSLLTGALMKISQAMGGLGITDAKNAIENEDFAPAIRLVLGYYDKMYRNALEKFNNRQISMIQSITGDAFTNAEMIIIESAGIKLQKPGQISSS
jgi:tRNA 2-selenouridine synthase